MKPIIDKYIILAKSVAVAFVVAFVACLTAVAGTHRHCVIPLHTAVAGGD